MVSRAVNVLKFQLEQTKEDIKKLKEIKQHALSDPITYVEKLRDGVSINNSIEFHLFSI